MRLRLVAGLSLAATACPGRLPFDPAEQVPDFTLQDANPASPTAGQPFSPRGLLGHVSAWYFGHAS